MTSRICGENKNADIKVGCLGMIWMHGLPIQIGLHCDLTLHTGINSALKEDF